MNETIRTNDVSVNIEGYYYKLGEDAGHFRNTLGFIEVRNTKDLDSRVGSWGRANDAVILKTEVKISV